MRTVEAYLQAHFGEPVSTERLASSAGMSPRTFTRRFKAATGRMPAAYLQALRIAAAKAMLERGEGPLQRVSERAGYDDLAFFRALFAPLSIAGEAVLEGVGPRSC